MSFDFAFIDRFCRTCGREQCVCGPVIHGARIRKENELHDRTMLAALQDVSFGRFNQKSQFVQNIETNGVRTHQQRWWLTKLVIMHRKQHGHHLALDMAETWMTDNGYPNK